MLLVMLPMVINNKMIPLSRMVCGTFTTNFTWVTVLKTPPRSKTSLVKNKMLMLLNLISVPLRLGR